LLGARRRHDTAAKLAHSLLKEFGIFSHTVGRDAIEGDAADFGFVIVAAQAVLLDGGQLRGGWILGVRNGNEGGEGEKGGERK